MDTISRRNLWVFRKAGHTPGAPQSGYDVDAFHARIGELIHRILQARSRGEQDFLRYGLAANAFRNEVDFVVHELFKEFRLRQGWGVPELSLTRTNGVAKAKEDWISDYLFAQWKYWSELEADTLTGTVAKIAERLDADARRASGRYSILEKMLRMSVGDLVLIPRTTESWQDENGFTVAEIAEKYRFENRIKEGAGTWCRDFGHILIVSRPVSYRSRLEFRAYRRAVNGPIRDADRLRYLGALHDFG
jgi:hypothetical protein